MDYLSEYPIKKRALVLEVGCGYGLGGDILRQAL